MPDVAALSVRIDADTTGLEAGLARANQSVSGFASTLGSVMTGAVVGGVAALGAGFVASAKSAADFEKQMSAVGAVAGASASEMEALTKTALQLGKDTSFSASEAAQGIEELVKAGVSVQDVMGGGARAALDLAAAGAVSVADAAEIASNAMNVFGLKGADMAHVADTIAGAANASAIGVNDYKFSLAAAGAVAATVGISFDSLSQAIAVMGNAGIKGSDAGTSLKTMLLNLQPTTKQQISLFRELGILTADGANKFFDASGKAKDFAGIAQVLQDSLKGMTKQQQLATLEIMFGSDAIRAGAVLLDAGAKGFEDMAAAMGKVTAQQVAEARLNNLWGSVEKLKGSLETAAIMLGGEFTPALKRMADSATDSVNVVIDALEQIPDVIETVRQVFAGEWAPDSSIRPFTLAVGEAAVMVRDQFGAALTTAGALLQQLAGWVQANIAPIAAFVAGFSGALVTIGLVTAGVTALAAVLGFLLSPIGLIAIAVGALAVAWQTNFLGIQEVVFQLVAVVQQALSGDIAGAFTAFIALLGATTAQIVEQLKLWGAEFVAWIAPMIPPMLAALADLAAQLMAWIAEQVPPLLAALLTWGQEFVAWVAPQIRPMLDELVKLFVQFMDWITAQTPSIVAKLTEWGLLFGAWVVTTAIPELVKALPGILAAILSWMVETNAVIITKLAALGQAIVDGIFQGFTAAWASIGPKIQQAISSVFTMPSLNFGGGGGGGTQLSTGGGSSHVSQYLPLINQVSAETGVPADVLAALMEVEGSGAGSTSPAGARGLMQVMPNYVLPGENPFDPLTSIRQGARAVTEKYRATGSWSGAGRAYFGYGVDAGGMDTNTYGARYDAARQRYQQSSTGPGAINKIPLTGAGAMAPLDAGPLPPFMNETFEALPDYQKSLDTIQQKGTETYTQVAGIAREQGLILAGSQTDALGNVMRVYSSANGDIIRTTTDASGQVVSQYATLASGVSLEMGNLSAGVTTSQQQLGANLLTTVTDTAGNYVGTVTTMSGQIVSQYVGTAAQVIASTAAQNLGVTTSYNMMAAGATQTVTDMGGQIVTKLTETSGLSTTTVTTMSGQILSQMTTLKDGTVVQMDDMGVKTTTAFDAMAQTTTTTVTTMSGTIITTVTDMNGQVVAQTIDTRTKVTQQWVQTSADVIKTAADMGLQVIGSSRKMGEDLVTTTKDSTGQMVTIVTNATGQVVAQFKTLVVEGKTVATGLDAAAGGLKKYADGLKAVGSAAAKAADQLEEFNKQAGGKASGSGNNPFAKRASGGPVSALTPYIVGEAGRELFIPGVDGYILPSVPEPLMLGGGGGSGGMQTIRLQVEIGGRVAEEIYVTGHRLAAERGRV